MAPGKVHATIIIDRWLIRTLSEKYHNYNKVSVRILNIRYVT